MKNKSKNSASEKTSNEGSGVVKLAVIGATLAGLAATTYFFLGPKGKTHRKHTKAWAIKMKGDIVEKLELAKYINEPMYHEIIDSIAGEYEKGKKATHKEIRALATDLKKHWKTIGSSAKVVKQDIKKNVIKAVKKVDDKTA